MSKLSLATSLADEIGVSVAKASKFVDDVGVDAARKSLDNATGTADDLVSRWWKPALGAGAIGTGGLLAYRQQDLDQARAIANQQQSYSDAYRSIIESDLPADMKQELIKDLNQSSPASGSNPNNQPPSGDDGGLIPDDAQTTLVLLIVVLFAVKFALDGGDD